MAFQGADIPFVGGAYGAPMVLQSAQELINFYCEISASKNVKEVIALLGCPGLNPVATTKAGPVRGAWVLPGSNQALVVTGNTLYLVTISIPATATSIPTFATTPVGTLLTTAGPVVMRDNGVVSPLQQLGGYVLIVDGTYGYFYQISGQASTVVFTGGVTLGSPTVTLPFLPNGLIIGSTTTLSDSAGLVPTSANIIAVDTINLTVTMSVPATGTNASDTLTLHIPAFGQITDPGFPTGVERLAFIEGWLIGNVTGTRSFFTSGPTPYQMLFPGSFQNLKDSSTDNLVTLEEQNRELWLIGERTSEVWYNAGGQNFAFVRLPGVGPQIGCAAKHSIARAGAQLVWLARNEQGQNMVVCSSQYSWQRLSTHAIEYAISQYPVVNDAIAYAYEDQGHLFYVLTFPTADVTWCFDFAVGREDPGAGWHKRLSFSNGQYHRHRSNCYMDFGNVRIVGDYLTGQLHQMSRNYYTDAGAPLRCMRRTSPVWQKANRERVFHSQLQIEFTPGVGLPSGQGSNPQAMLRWSDDGGFNWSSESWVTIGKTGNTLNRAIWRLLSVTRDRVYELCYSDPTPRDIIGSTLFAEGTAG